MVFHFLLLSGEKEDFVREILIDGESTFLDFHKAIQNSVGYDQSQLASFFVADDEWEKGLEITMMKMDEASGCLLMEDVKLNEYVDEPKDKLIYTFDFFGNRGFFVELLGLAKESVVKEARCVRTEGEVPEQIMIDDFGAEDEMDIFDMEEDEFSEEFEEVGLDALGEEW